LTHNEATDRLSSFILKFTAFVFARGNFTWKIQTTVLDLPPTTLWHGHPPTTRCLCYKAETFFQKRKTVRARLGKSNQILLCPWATIQPGLVKSPSDASVACPMPSPSLPISDFLLPLPLLRSASSLTFLHLATRPALLFLLMLCCSILGLKDKNLEISHAHRYSGTAWEVIHHKWRKGWWLN